MASKARVRKLGRETTSYSWAARHTWVTQPTPPILLSREQIDIAPDHAVSRVISAARSGAGNYRHYYSWSSVQLTLEIRIKKGPNDSWSESRLVPAAILKRKGLGYLDFLRESLTTRVGDSPPLLTSLGISFYLVEVQEIAVHHYRRR